MSDKIHITMDEINTKAREYSNYKAFPSQYEDLARLELEADKSRKRWEMRSDSYFDNFDDQLNQIREGFISSISGMRQHLRISTETTSALIADEALEIEKSLFWENVFWLTICACITINLTILLV